LPPAAISKRVLGFMNAAEPCVTHIFCLIQTVWAAFTSLFGPEIKIVFEGLSTKLFSLPHSPEGATITEQGITFTFGLVRQELFKAEVLSVYSCWIFVFVYVVLNADM